MKKISFLMVTASVTGLTACGGGGGGGGPSYLYYDPSFIGGPNVTATATLYSRRVISQEVGGVPTSMSDAGTGTDSLRANFDANSEVSSISLSNQYGTATFTPDQIASGGSSSAGGQTINYVIGLNGGASFATYDLNDDYMDFGSWSLGQQSGTGTRYSSFFVAGYETPLASMPLSGTANYTGLSTGVFFDRTDSSVYAVGSTNFSASVSFASSSMSLSTTSTELVDLATLISTPSSQFNFAGSGSISGNSFSGSLALARGETGAFSGKFFGPSAGNLGGTFGFSLPEGVYNGVFGAKR